MKVDGDYLLVYDEDL